MTTTEIESPKLELLEAKAKALLDSLKIKHKDTATPNAMEIAARGAYAVWLKAAKENPRTGAAQIDENMGITSLERYLLARLPKK